MIELKTTSQLFSMHWPPLLQSHSEHIIAFLCLEVFPTPCCVRWRCIVLCILYFHYQGWRVCCNAWKGFVKKLPRDYCAWEKNKKTNRQVLDRKDCIKKSGPESQNKRKAQLCGKKWLNCWCRFSDWHQISYIFISLVHVSLISICHLLVLGVG